MQHGTEERKVIEVGLYVVRYILEGEGMLRKIDIVKR
jgi:hypothetical protein